MRAPVGAAQGSARPLQFRGKGLAQAVQPFRLLRLGDQGLHFVGVGAQVVQFLAHAGLEVADILPPLVDDGRVPRYLLIDGPFRALLQHPGHILAEVVSRVLVQARVRPVCGGALQQRREVATVQPVRRLHPGEREERGNQVGSVCRLLAHLPGRDRTGHGDDQRRAVAGIVGGDLHAQPMLAHREPLVGGVDHQRVFELPGLLQGSDQVADPLVDGRHALVDLAHPVRERGTLAAGLVAHLFAALARDDLPIARPAPRQRVLQVVRFAGPGAEDVGRCGHPGSSVHPPVPRRGLRGPMDAAVAQP
jgi:hypothetical protein